ncbi:hypothetical protein B7P43_G01003 [Cryptotermes secundus]|uniref:Uncharacterized protein n=1 Tax=Cryptotermes secundus TaxID=105785 RepID=A0A2J7PG62_9NEOP|nr:hypothetical protein B7P43_G01003 [Cryptotermes secundus]
MVFVDRSCLFFLAVLLIIIPSFTLSAESDPQQSDHHIDNDFDRSKFRDKRTLDIILQGLAQMLGYRLQRNNAQTATIPQTLPPPTEPPKFITQPTSTPPSQIVFLSVSDIADLKHKKTAGDSDKNRDYPYSRYRDGRGKDENGDGYSRSDYNRGGSGKDGQGTEKTDKYYRSRFRSDKIDDYIQTIGQHSKGPVRSGKRGRNDEKMGQSSGKSNQLKNSGAGSDQKWDKEHVESEYDKPKVFNHDKANHKLSESKHNGDDANAVQEEQKEVTIKSDNDESSNEADSKSPETIKEKLEQNHREEETVEQQQHKSTQVNSEQEHNSKQESGEKDSTDQNQGEHSKEEEHQDGDYHNQIPAPSLQTWDDDFWNSRYSFADNSPYEFGLRDTQKSDTDEQKDKPSQPHYQYTRPKYFDGPGFEPVHEWHVSSGSQSEKPSFESSESQNELKEGEEEEDDERTPHGSSGSPEEHTDPSFTENPDLSKPPTHGQDVTDKPPMPIHSTSRPKLAELIHEIEGTKQNPLWPPPFDHAFEGTDSSVDIQHPEQTNVTSSKKAPDHTSPLLLNLYNYTSISDYLLDLNKKDLLQKQPSRSSQQNAKIDHDSENDDKSPVSYVAVVIPHKSRNKHVEKSDHYVPPEPSFVGVAYPQELSSKYAEHALSTTAAKSDRVKDNRTPRYKPLTESHISNLSQKLRHNDYDEAQDPPLESHYSPLFHGSSSSLESSNSSGDNIQKFPDSYFSPFFHNPEIDSNTNRQPQSVRTSSNSSGYHGDKTYNPSAVSPDGRQQVLSTPKPLRLVIPELQPHTLPDPQTSQLRVVIPDVPQSESFFDISSGNEQNEPKNEAFENHFGLMTIPPPTPYSGHPASVKNPEKWVLGDDAPRTKNLKTKEHTIRVSKMRVTGKVHTQPNANLTEV